MKKEIIRCEYNMDTCCVELKYCDGSLIRIDTIAIENAVETDTIQQAALDHLIYNKPVEYTDLVLNSWLGAS